MDDAGCKVSLTPARHSPECYFIAKKNKHQARGAQSLRKRRFMPRPGTSDHAALLASMVFDPTNITLNWMTKCDLLHNAGKLQVAKVGCPLAPFLAPLLLELLDWTGRQVRSDKRGAIPADLAPILQRLQVSTDCWVDLVTGFGRWFRRTVGRPSSMVAASQRHGRCWSHGISHARRAFA